MGDADSLIETIEACSSHTLRIVRLDELYRCIHCVHWEHIFCHRCCCTWQYWFECTNETSPTIAVITKTWFIEMITLSTICINLNFKWSFVRKKWISEKKMICRFPFCWINSNNSFRFKFHFSFHSFWCLCCFHNVNTERCELFVVSRLFYFDCLKSNTLQSFTFQLFILFYDVVNAQNGHRSPNKHCIFI